MFEILVIKAALEFFLTTKPSLIFCFFKYWSNNFFEYLCLKSKPTLFLAISKASL
jgi:hypothetical protein